jgi:hypothetical protein
MIPMERLGWHKFWRNRWGRALRVGCWLMGATRLGLARPPQTEADALFEQGKVALKAGNWPDACDKFHRSLSLDPSPSTWVKVARCHEHDGQLKMALRDYDQALLLLYDRSKASAHARDLERLVKTSKQALEARVGRLRLRFVPAVEKAELSIDGTPVTADATAWIPLDPGTHRISADIAGFQPASLEVALAESESREVSVQLRSTPIALQPASNRQALPTAVNSQPASNRQTLPTAVNSQPASNRQTLPTVVNSHPASNRPQSPTTATVPHPLALGAAVHPGQPQGPPAILSRSTTSASPHEIGRVQRVAGVVAAGVGLTLGGVAAYLGYRTHQLVQQSRLNNHCDVNFACDKEGRAIIDDAGRTRTQALLLGGAATLVVGTGIVLVATAPSGTRAPNSERPALSLYLSPFGVRVGGMW